MVRIGGVVLVVVVLEEKEQQIYKTIALEQVGQVYLFLFQVLLPIMVGEEEEVALEMVQGQAPEDKVVEVMEVMELLL
tara:strand:+ start:155 stop:388 length:234 start_codon:yes stop_codon:yes gene_type:complete